MNALQNASYHITNLLHQELTSGPPTSESESGHTDIPRKEHYSSGESFDSAFENEDFRDKRVSFAKVRCYSESAEPSTPVRRGILKRFSNSRVRFFSESSVEAYRDRRSELENGVDFSQTGSVEEEDDQARDPDSDENDGDKVKKTVRFSDTVHRQLFRSNSSILGQRKKNQRKQRNKKRKEEDKLSSSTESVDQIMCSVEQLIIDSGTEVDVENESCNEAHAPKPVQVKKNKKQKKGRNRRKSTESDLIFDLDL